MKITNALAEMEVIMDSISYKANALKESLVGLAQNSITQDFLKDIIDNVTKMIEAFDESSSSLQPFFSTIGAGVGIVSNLTQLLGGLGSTLAVIFSYNALRGGKFTFFKTITNDVTGAVKGVSLFGKELNKISTWKSQGVFKVVDQADTNALKNYATLLGQGTSNNKAFRQTMLDANTATKNEAKSIRDLNAQRKNGTISNEQYRTKTQEIIQSTEKLTLAQKTSAAMSKIMGTALNVAMNVGVALLINLAVTGIMKLVNAQKEAKETAKQTAEAYKEQSESLRNLKDEYLAIVDGSQTEIEKNKELIEWKKKLVEQYRLEKDAIENVNIERQTGLDLIDEENYKQSEKAFNDLKDTYQNSLKEMSASSVEFNALGLGFIDKEQSRAYSDGTSLSQFEDIKQYLSEFKDLGISIEEFDRAGLYNIGVTIDSENTEDMVSKLSKTLFGLKRLQTQYADDGENTFYLDRTISVFQAMYDKFTQVVTDNKDIVEQGTQALTETTVSDFIKAGNAIEKVTEDSFVTWKDSLIDLAGENIPLQEALAEYADNLFPDFVTALAQTENPVQTFNTSLQSVNTTISMLREQMNDIISNADKFTSAIEKMKKGENLSSDEVFDLLEIDPTLSKDFAFDGNGYTIPVNVLLDYQNDYITENKTALANAVGIVETDVKNSSENLKKLLAERDNILANSSGNAVDNKLLADINQYITKEQEILEKANNQLGTKSFALDMFENIGDSDNALAIIKEFIDGFKDIQTEIDGYNSSIKLLDTAISNMNNETALTYDEMISLVSAYPTLNGLVEKRTDGYYLEVGGLEALREASYDTRNQRISDEKAMTEDTLELANLRIMALEIEMRLLYSSGNATEEKATQIRNLLNSAKEDYAEILQDLAVLDFSTGEIFPDTSNLGNSSDDVKDTIQEEIDYYELLISAIETVADKRIEAFESEIEILNEKKKLLEEEKDALKEKNDEQQREIDLINAKNNLDKAKKQKVFVYQEGKGLVQVSDQKAINEAQKEYDNVLNSIKEAEIDKKIANLDTQNEAIEKQKENTEEYKDMYSNLSSTIEDTLRVEQAKKALGVDENGLLNLSDDTIEKIQTGLTTAIYNKDKEDNKENSFYQEITLSDFLKSLGSPLSDKELNLKSTFGLDNVNSKLMPSVVGNSNNLSTINNNGNVTISPVFNINGAGNPQDVANAVNQQFTKLLNGFKNWVK